MMIQRFPELKRVTVQTLVELVDSLAPVVLEQWEKLKQAETKTEDIVESSPGKKENDGNQPRRSPEHSLHLLRQ